MGGKKVKGRKRHIVTDTQGHLLHVKVHSATPHDGMAGCDVIEEMVETYPTLDKVCADGGYSGTFVAYLSEMFCMGVDIVKRLPQGWKLQPVRWVVERTFAWFNGYRRLNRDVEITTASAEAQINIAHLQLLFKRLPNL
jgi:transposase